MFYVFTKKTIVDVIPVHGQETIIQNKTLEETSFSVNQENFYSEYISFSGNKLLVSLFGDKK